MDEALTKQPVEAVVEIAFLQIADKAHILRKFLEIPDTKYSLNIRC